MEKRPEYMTETTRCPRCNAVCVTGHDDDGQVFCAKCGLSFIPKETKLLNPEEYRKLREEAKSRHERAAWIAYTVE